MEYYPTIQLSFVHPYTSGPKFKNITDVSDLCAWTIRMNYCFVRFADYQSLSVRTELLNIWRQSAEEQGQKIIFGHGRHNVSWQKGRIKAYRYINNDVKDYKRGDKNNAFQLRLAQPAWCVADWGRYEVHSSSDRSYRGGGPGGVKGCRAGARNLYQILP